MSSLPCDGAYKLLFSHPEMVEALLRGFVAEDWVDQIDFSTLDKLGAEYISDELLQRRDDIVWRVRLNLPDGGSEWLYLYLLLEFQSRPDPWMALRLLGYVCLMYQELIKRDHVKGGRLPPVFPLVLYNGLPRWQAAQDIAELIHAPGQLTAWMPRFRYFLLDEGRVPATTLASRRDNLVAHLIELEALPRNPEGVARLAGQLARKLRAPEYDSLRRAFVVFINHVVSKRDKNRQNAVQFKDL